MSLAITIGLLLVLMVVVVIAVWKFGRELAALRQQVSASQAIASEVSSIKAQIQSLPVALGDLGAIKSQVETISGAAQSIGGIKSQVETLSTSVQDLGAIKSGVDLISQTMQQIGSIRTDLEQVKTREAQLGETINRIANKLIGTREIGAAGENLLAEAFAQFPPGWIETDFRVGGKVVEFALVLPNQKRLPIDSKFPAGSLLERLGEEEDAQLRQELIKQIENAIFTKAQEAAKYIDPARTIPLAVAAVPDAAYSVCRKVHFQAIGADVLVISYSMALPVILALYRFQL
jgi:DNA anti-recombination protein RmuC